MFKKFLFILFFLSIAFGAIFWAQFDPNKYAQEKLNDYLKKAGQSSYISFRKLDTNANWPAVFKIEDLKATYQSCLLETKSIKISLDTISIMDLWKEKLTLKNISISGIKLDCPSALRTKKTKAEPILNSYQKSLKALNFVKSLELNFDSLRYSQDYKSGPLDLKVNSDGLRLDIILDSKKELQIKENTLPSFIFRTSVELEEESISINSSIEKLFGQFKSSLSINLKDEKIEKGVLFLQSKPLKFLKAFEKIPEGLFTIDTKINGAFNSPNLSGSIKLSKLKAYDLELEEAKLPFNLNKDNLELKSFIIKHKSADLEGNLKIGLGGLKADFTSKIKDLDWVPKLDKKHFEKAKPQNIELKSSISSAANFKDFKLNSSKWPLSNISFELKSEILAKQLKGPQKVFSKGFVTLKGEEKDRHVFIKELNLKMNKMLLKGFGSAKLDKENFNFNLEGKMKDISGLKSFLRDKNLKSLKGGMELSSKISGSFKKPNIKGKLRFSKLQAKGQMIGEVEASFLAEKLQTFKLLNLTGENRFISWQGEGAYNLSKKNGDFLFRVLNLDLAKLPKLEPGMISGSGDGEIKINLDKNNYRAIAKINFENPILSKWKGDHAKTLILIKNNQIERGNFQFRTREKIKPQILSMNFKTREKDESFWADLRLQNLRYPGVKGIIRGYVTFLAPIKNPRMMSSNGIIEFFDQKGKNVRSNVSGKLLLKPKPGFVFAEFKTRNKLGVMGELQMDLKEPMDFNGKFILDSKGINLANITLDYKGGFDFKGNLSPKLNYKANGILTSMKVQSKIANVTLEKPIEVKIEENKAIFKSFILSAGKQQKCIVANKENIISIAGEGSEDKISIDFNCDVKLQTLPSPTSAIAYWGGLAKAKGFVGGSSKKPKVFLEADVNKLQLKIKGMPDMVDDGNAKVFINFFDKDKFRINISKYEISYGLGKILGNGTVEMISEDKPVLINISNRASNVLWRKPEEFPVRMSGEIDVNGTDEELWIKGRVNIHEAVYNKTMSIAEEFTNVFRRPSSNYSTALSEKDLVNFDILLNFPKSLKVRNNFADIVLSGQLRLLGTPLQYGALGNLNLVSGTANFNNNKYEVKNFVLNFNDRKKIYPYFNLSVFTQVRDEMAEEESESLHPITVHIKGYPDKYSMKYESEGDLTLEDRISLLTLGFRQNKMDLEDRKNDNAALLGKGLGFLSKLSGIGFGGKGGVPKTNVQLKSKYDDAGNFVPQLVFSLEILRGMDLRLEAPMESKTRNNEQKVKLDYRISNVVSISGEWDSNPDTKTNQTEPDYGLDLKLKWDF